MPIAMPWLRLACLAAVMSAPLAYGGDRPLLWHLHAALLGGLALLVRAPLPPTMGWAAGLFGAVVAWVVVQMLPVPAFLASPFWAEAAAVLGQDVTGRISLAPLLTRQALMRMMSDAAALWLGWALFRDSDGRRLLLQAMVWVITLIAVYGLVIWLLGNGTVLGIAKWGHRDALTGTFFGRNTFGAFLILGLLPAAELAMRDMVMRSEDRRWWRLPLLLLAIAILLTALVLTRSRVGIMLGFGALGLLVMLRLLARRRVAWLPQVMLGGFVLVALLAAAAALLVALQPDRLARLGEDAVTRIEIMRMTWGTVLTRPWTGHGFGTFEAMFPAFRGPITINVTWDNPHNIYIEAMAGLGIPTTLLLLLAIGLPMRMVAAGLTQRDSAGSMARVAFAAAVALGVQGMQEFALLVPGVSLPFWLLVGAAAVPPPVAPPKTPPFDRRTTPGEPIPTGSVRPPVPHHPAR